jgi:hypothetical protein
MQHFLHAGELRCGLRHGAALVARDQHRDFAPHPGGGGDRIRHARLEMSVIVVRYN